MSPTPDAVLRRRLAVQGLSDPRFARAEQVVELLTAVQSQEFGHALWSLGQRMPQATLAGLRSAFDAGDVLRTHVLRPTWHFVTPADIRWLLRLTAPRVVRASASIYRKVELDETVLDRCLALVGDLLAGGQPRTRTEIGMALGEAGIPASGLRLTSIAMYAELQGLVCSGPLRGTAHTYALLDERAPAAAATEPDDPLTELVVRFFTGHGPADERDFARWSWLTLTDTRAGLAEAGDRLESVVVDGTRLWAAPGGTYPPPSGTRTAYLLPLYDEALLTYPRLRFPAAPGHPHPPDTDLLVGSVVLDGVDVGTWRRTVGRSEVTVESSLAPGVDAAGRQAVAEAEQRLHDFLTADAG